MPRQYRISHSERRGLSGVLVPAAPPASAPSAAAAPPAPLVRHEDPPAELRAPSPARSPAVFRPEAPGPPGENFRLRSGQWLRNHQGGGCTSPAPAGAAACGLLCNAAALALLLARVPTHARPEEVVDGADGGQRVDHLETVCPVT
eukprot:453586-Rhodomonas_salina.1